MDNTLLQGYAVLLYLYAGIALRLVYDTLSIVRRLLDRRAVTHALDAIFVLAFTAIAYTAIQLADEGNIRLYGLCAIACGAALFHWAIGGPICKRIVKRRA